MPRVTYVSADGEEYIAEVDCGASAMDGAIWNLVPGIEGDCGGFATCGTCLVSVDPAWAGQTGPAGSENEAELIEMNGNAAGSFRRLACQIQINDELDGLILHMPESQY